MINQLNQDMVILFSRLHSRTQQSLLSSLVPKMSMKEVELSVWEFSVVCLVVVTLIKLDRCGE